MRNCFLLSPAGGGSSRVITMLLLFGLVAVPVVTFVTVFAGRVVLVNVVHFVDSPAVSCGVGGGGVHDSVT